MVRHVRKLGGILRKGNGHHSTKNCPCGFLRTFQKFGSANVGLWQRKKITPLFNWDEALEWEKPLVGRLRAPPQTNEKIHAGLWGKPSEKMVGNPDRSSKICCHHQLLTGFSWTKVQENRDFVPFRFCKSGKKSNLQTQQPTSMSIWSYHLILFWCPPISGAVFSKFTPSAGMTLLQPDENVLDLFRALDGLHKAYWRLGSWAGRGWELGIQWSDHQEPFLFGWRSL